MEDDAYFYHVTKERNIPSICKRGLKQSNSGYEGKGTYLAVSPDKTYGYHISKGENGNTIIRVDKKELIKRFGRFHYKNNPSGRVEGDFEGVDDGAIIVRGNIPAGLLSYQKNGRWKKCPIR